MSRAFPSFDGEFKDIMTPQDLDESGNITQEDPEPFQHAPASDAELFMANINDFSEIRTIHEDMFCRLPSSQDLSFGGADGFPHDSMDSLYLETFYWSYQTAAVVNAISPCKLPYLCIVESVFDRGYL